MERIVYEARSLWRETPLHDVGIDGQIEHVSTETEIATGRLVAAQVKSGTSYFATVDRGAVIYTPEARHRAYWARFPLPVLLILHEPDAEVTFWADARAQLRAGSTQVKVPQRQVFDKPAVSAALAIEGPLPSGSIDPLDVIEEMMANRTDEPGFDISFFDLFFNGLTDVARSLYFGMDLVSALIEHRAWRNDTGWGIGSASYAFLDRFVDFLIGRDLAHVDLPAWVQMADQMQMTGTFVVPLTTLGRAVVEQATVLDAGLEHAGPESVIARERPVEILKIGLGERADHTREFEDRFAELREGR